MRHSPRTPRINTIAYRISFTGVNPTFLQSSFTERLTLSTLYQMGEKRMIVFIVYIVHYSHSPILFDACFPFKRLNRLGGYLNYLGTLHGIIWWTNLTTHDDVLSQRCPFDVARTQSSIGFAFLVQLGVGTDSNTTSAKVRWSNRHDD